jgi:hypothetical protein
MPGPNLTGQPDTRDYLLGRGRLYFAELLPNGQPGAFRDLGNAPEFRLTTTEETLQHRSSREGVAFTDAEVVISKETTFAFQLDEVNHENLAALFSGVQQDVTNAAVAGFGAHTMIESVELARWYDIIDDDGVRAYCIDKDDLTVSIQGGATLTEGEDYLVDEEFGRIFFLSNPEEATLLPEVGITVTLDPDSGAAAVDSVDGMRRTGVKGALKFISVNPQNNDFEQEFMLWKCSLKADGDFNLIGDEWAQMGFTGAAERNTELPGAPTLTVRSCRQS